MEAAAGVGSGCGTNDLSKRLLRTPRRYARPHPPSRHRPAPRSPFTCPAARLRTVRSSSRGRPAQAGAATAARVPTRHRTVHGGISPPRDPQLKITLTIGTGAHSHRYGYSWGALYGAGCVLLVRCGVLGWSDPQGRAAHGVGRVGTLPPAGEVLGVGHGGLAALKDPDPQVDDPTTRRALGHSSRIYDALRVGSTPTQPGEGLSTVQDESGTSVHHAWSTELLPEDETVRALARTQAYLPERGMERAPRADARGHPRRRRPPPRRGHDRTGRSLNHRRGARRGYDARQQSGVRRRLTAGPACRWRGVRSRSRLGPRVSGDSLEATWLQRSARVAPAAHS